MLLQETWQTPEPNPAAPLRCYHELLVATAEHPYKSLPADAARARASRVSSRS